VVETGFGDVNHEVFTEQHQSHGLDGRQTPSMNRT
jgi:hypothetical protein